MELTWTSSSFEVELCATSGTRLPVKVTLGNHTSAPFVKTITVRAPVPCGAGDYSDENDACAPCPTGRHGANDTSTLTACEPCGLGQYADVPGLSVCPPCPINTVSGVVADASSCAECGKVRVVD